MSWKIVIDSDTCPHLNKWEKNCCHPNNFMKPCDKTDCPLVKNLITKEAAGQMVIDLIMLARKDGQNLLSHDRLIRDDAIEELTHAREELIKALTGKEE